MLEALPIMSVAFHDYYAVNDAGIIGTGLIQRQPLIAEKSFMLSSGNTPLHMIYTATIRADVNNYTLVTTVHTI